MVMQALKQCSILHMQKMAIVPSPERIEHYTPRQTIIRRFCYMYNVFIQAQLIVFPPELGARLGN